MMLGDRDTPEWRGKDFLREAAAVVAAAAAIRLRRLGDTIL
jgi:hypothetical protein